MPDLESDYDSQDSAEAFDETHRIDEMAVGEDEPEDAPDLDDDVPDLTSALGDADEDDLVAADDMDPEDLDDLDLDDEDEDEDDDLDDDLEDEPEDDDVEDIDDSVDVENTAKAQDSDRLDEGLEETFPASDPVSAKHIS